MEIALIFQEQRGQLADLAGFFPPCSAPCLHLVVLEPLLPLRDGWKDKKEGSREGESSEATQELSFPNLLWGEGVGGT